MRIIIIAGFAFLAVGCGPRLPTHPVSGRVVIAGNGDPGLLANAHVEFALAGDLSVRGSGLVAADGSFTVEMLHEGRILKGLPPGTYLARLLLSDDVPRGNKPLLIARRYLDFKTSGLAANVPLDDDLVVEVALK